MGTKRSAVPRGRRLAVVARRVALPLAAAALALVAWAYQHSDLPFLLFFGDEHEYAEIGRRIAGGRGSTPA